MSQTILVREKGEELFFKIGRKKGNEVKKNYFFFLFYKVELRRKRGERE